MNGTIRISKCRICNGTNLESIIDFGEMALTGIFALDGSSVDKEPLELIRCSNCGLAQLRNSYDSKILYGDSYGYESHLNESMRKHLQRKAILLEKKFLNNKEQNTVVDIASNDGTFLSYF